MATARLSVPTKALFGLAVVALFGAAASCGETESNTELNPDGPPMVRQVFVQEQVSQEGGPTRVLLNLAFGSHPDLADDDGMVGSAVAGTGQEIRIVMDELLNGNRLEEIACADGSFSVVPDGTTPADIAACAGPVDAIVEQGCDAVCIGADGPVGVLDEEPPGGGDGAADDFRLRGYDGALPVSVTCDGVDIPISRETSFWSPSGNQLIPANDLGVRGIGPALVIKTERGLRTGASCSIAFHPEVVDKDGNQVCAPPGGDISQSCNPGDTAAISFGVVPFSVEVLDPVDGATDVATNVVIILQFNSAIDPATAGDVSLAEAGGADVPLDAMVQEDDPSLVFLEAPGGLSANTDYVLTVPTTVTDTFGGALPEEVTTEFTTGDAASTPDAGMPDAMPDAMP